MKKINFEGLPSTNTPISPDNLNEMQDNIEESAVVVSATQPTTNEKVWIQKGNNLFNKNNAVLGTLQADGTISTDNSYYTSDFIKVVPNTIYYKTMSTSARFKYYYKDKTQYSSTYTDLSNAQNAQAFTIPANVYYIRLSVSSTLIDTFQINTGSVAKPYEAYIEPKIYVKNDNGVYEEFVNLNNLHTKTKTIWNGSLHTTNETIVLQEALEEGNLYIFTFYGLSSTYLVQVPFTYKSGNFQYAYYDGTNYFRMRLDITSGGAKITVNSASVNNAANTALISIEKVY